MKKITLIIWLTILVSSISFAQKDGSYEKAMQYLREKGEVIFTFKANSKQQFLELNEFLSVSHKRVDENLLEVEAYANKDQFQRFLSFGLAYRVTAEDNEIPQEFTQYSTQAVNAWDTTWDAYPKYSEYVAKMQYWAATYPSLCTLQSIGTTTYGRNLYVLKISDNASADETEPEFFYTSSMHGDEITGYVTMLRFIDYLLTNYNTDTEVTSIVNGTELYINPLANPDGSYRGATNDIYNAVGFAAIRGNANNIDLNRNYPDAIGGMHPDNAVYQIETTAFLNFEATRNFVMGANYHGGTEVFNFPLDTSNTPNTGNFSYHPHDNYFKFVSQEYAQLCQTADGNLDYMDTVYNVGQFPGTTNGAAWYSVYGGRQDCNNFFNHNKESTIEISDLKTPLASSLPFFWDRNRQALLNYVKQASYGLHGTVTDANGNPIHAKVYIGGTFDNFGSWVETSPTKGDYHKVQIAGAYNVIFEAPGYTSQTIPVTLTNFATTTLNVVMTPTTSLPTASDATICTGQSANLSATGTGTIRWYNAANATNPLVSTANYTTPVLTSTTSYWVEREVTPANLGPTTVSGSSTTNTSIANRYLIFNCTTPTKLKSVLINATAAGQIHVELQNSAGVMLESKVVRLSVAGAQDIALDFFLPAENGLRLVSRQITNTNMFRATTGITYPITNGTVSITGNSGAGIFFQFYNWKFGPTKSNRDEVIVTVTPNPTNASLNPNSKLAGSSDFTLTVNGTNFISGQSIVRWNGANLPTTFVSSTELSAAVTASQITTVGTANVTIFNTCNSTTTSALVFNITQPNPAASLHFDGINDRVDVPNNATLQFGTQNLTMEAKIKLDGSQASFAGIISKASVSGFFKGIQLIISGNRLGLEIGNGTNIFYGTVEGLITSQDLNDGNWHHVAVVVNRSTKKITLFVDGVIQANLTSDFVPTMDLSNNLPFYIGVERTGVAHFKGNIDEVRVWNRALCISEIQANMNCESNATSSLLANYHFNQGSDSLNNTTVTSLTDASGNNLSGTLSNFSLTGSTSNWIGVAGVPSGVNCNAFVDTEAPTPNVTNLPTITAQCSTTLTAPSATDTCAGNIIGTTAILTFNTQGTHNVVWSYNDGSGNITTQNQTVIIDDTIAPVPNLSSLPPINAQCGTTVSTIPTASDNCMGTITATTTSSLIFNSQGTFIIPWLFNDGNGNSIIQNQTVIIDDTIAPVANNSSLPTITETCSATLTAPTATDNCVGTVTATTSNPLTYSTAGTYIVTWNYNDGNGNSSSQNQVVIISVGGTVTTFYADNDGDGFGDATSFVESCIQPNGYVGDNLDCDDNLITYQDIDNDGYGSFLLAPCGVTNSDDLDDNDPNSNTQTYYQDADGDGYGNPLVSIVASSQPLGYVQNNTDCNDNEIQYADTDNDGFGSTTMVACGVADNSDCNDNLILYLDADNDGFGTTTIVACGVANNSDCNDNQIQYGDADGDGFGSTPMVACGVANNSDCNDNLLLYLDADGDGFGTTTLVPCTGSTWNNDCNDANATVKPLLLTSLTQTISANLVSGAQTYRFRVTNMTTNQVRTIDRSVRTFNLTQVSNYAFGTSFYIEVSVRVNNVFSNYTRIPPCVVISPTVYTKLQTSQCGINITNLGTNLNANIVSYAAGYRFRITDTNDPTFVRIYDTTLRYFRLSVIPGIQYNKTYSIDVAIKNTTGTYLPFGQTCIVSTNNSPAKMDDSVTENSFNLTVSPNPFNANFSVKLDSESPENEYTFEVFDMLGRMLESKTLQAEALESVSFGDNYPSGIYNIIVSNKATNVIKTCRIIKR